MLTSPEEAGKKLPRSIRVVALAHVACLVACAVACANCEPSAICKVALPDPLASSCSCNNLVEGGGVKLSCKGLSSTSVFSSLEQEELSHNNIADDEGGSSGDRGGSGNHKMRRDVAQIVIEDSDLRNAILDDFGHFENLKSLTLTDCRVHTLLLSSIEGPLFRTLLRLDLSHNALSSLPNTSLAHSAPALRAFNLSHNDFAVPPDISEFYHLEVLDLSYNRISEDAAQEAFEGLPRSLRYLNLSGKRNVCLHYNKSF